MVVKVDNVTKKIKRTVVLEDISLVFRSGIVTGLRGINGSGKTMLLRIISGLIKPTEGSVKIDEEILFQNISFPRSIGILIENPAFLDYYSGYENLKLLAKIKGIATDNDILKIIYKVGLNPSDKKKYKHYSLGMKQRLGIAAALMEKPDLILLDEPTNALDTDGIAMLKELLLEEKARGATIILTCHDHQILKELSDEIVFISNGRIEKTEKIR